MNVNDNVNANVMLVLMLMLMLMLLLEVRGGLGSMLTALPSPGPSSAKLRTTRGPCAATRHTCGSEISRTLTLTLTLTLMWIRNTQGWQRNRREQGRNEAFCEVYCIYHNVLNYM